MKLLEKLVKLANRLDEKKLYSAADEIDQVIQKIALNTMVARPQIAQPNVAAPAASAVAKPSGNTRQLMPNMGQMLQKMKEDAAKLNQALAQNPDPVTKNNLNKLQVLLDTIGVAHQRVSGEQPYTELSATVSI